MSKKNKTTYDTQAKNVTVTIEQKPVEFVSNTEVTKVNVKNKTIAEQLLNKTDFLSERLKELEDWWERKGYDTFLNVIKNNFYRTCDKDFTLSITIDDLSHIVYDENLEFQVSDMPYDFVFIRNKLWSEGINCKLDLECTLHISIKNEDDDFEDSLLCFKDSDIEHHLRDNSFLSYFAEYKNMSVEDVGVLIRKKYYNIPV